MEQIKYDVFISYSRKDYKDEQKNVIPGNEVSKIKEALTKAGITYWFDEDGIYSGNEFTEKIVDNIEASHIFLFLSTKNACDSSWTSKEIACAHEFGKYIIPVRIDRTPYNKKVMFRIADLSYVDYGMNPEKGLKEIIISVKTYLRELKASEELKKVEEERRKEELERQRREQEEAKKRQQEIERIEAEISALESQKVEREKTVLQKEQELKLAQLDLKTCEAKILKLQAKLEEIRNSRTKVTIGKNEDKESSKSESIFNQITQAEKLKDELKMGSAKFKKTSKDDINELLENTSLSETVMALQNNKCQKMYSEEDDLSSAFLEVQHSKEEILHFIKSFCNNKLINNSTNISKAKIRFNKLSKGLSDTYDINISEHKLKYYTTIGDLIDDIWKLSN